MEQRLNNIRRSQDKLGVSSIVLALFVLLVLISCKQSKRSEADHSAHDSTMSEMKGMDMSNVDSEKSRDTSALMSLVTPVNYQVISSQKSVKPTLHKDVNHFHAQGYISMDERLNNKVSARISGRIEKLYIRYNLQRVNKGDKIMEVYSPELNTYQEEFLYLLKNKSDQSLTNQAEEKLRLLGIGQEQINALAKTGVPFHTMTVYSPQSGFVFFSAPAGSQKNLMSQAQLSQQNGMGEMQSSSGTSGTSYVSENVQLREGIYVNKGDVLFWINDLQRVWGIVAAANSHSQDLKVGSRVSMVSEFYKNDTIKAEINFIEPSYQPDQKFATARIYLPNVNYKYKINSLIDAEIAASEKSILTVPSSCILFLGKRKIVWVLKGISSGHNRIYEARDVNVGPEYDDRIEIKSGLSADEEVAINAGYLLDRESLIKP